MSMGALIRGMRPRQWPKNLVVLAAVIFADRFTQPRDVAVSLAAVVVFSLLASAAYLLNDVHDRERDRAHESKRLRPVASGELTVPAAVVAAILIAVVALVVALSLGLPFAGVAGGFLCLQLAYTVLLKHQVLLDVMAIAAGFVLRAAAGAVAIGVTISPWLLLCAALLAMFLALGKRRHELLLLESGAGAHRASLEHYTPALIDQLLSAVTAATIVSYALYTFSSPASRSHDYLILTLPFVIYGVFRYLYLVYRQDLGGSPEEILLTDVPLMVDVALWLAASLAVLSL